MFKIICFAEERMNILRVFKSHFLVTYIVLALFLLIGEVGAATYYVSPNGNDTNSGSISAPFRTIQRAADLVRVGDTVNIRAGTYGNFKLRNKNGTASAWIVFKPYLSETVTIDPYTNNYANAEQDINIGGSSYIEIKGLNLTNTDPNCDSENYTNYSQVVSNDGIKIDTYSSISSHHIRIYENTIYHTGGEGILSTSSSHDVEIVGNTIRDIGLSKRGYGMYIQGSKYVIRDNVIYHAYGYGLHVYSDSEVPSEITIERNRIHKNGHTDYGKGYSSPNWPPEGELRGDGVLVWATGSTIRNNLIYGNLGDGISVRYSGNAIYNNTIYKNGGRGISIGNTGGIIIRNNIAYLNGSSNNYNGNTQSNNLTTDPKFVNAAAGDFNLVAGSSAIDAGYPTSSILDDYAGRYRPQGMGYDIGAYEYVGTSDTTPPAPPAIIEVK